MRTYAPAENPYRTLMVDLTHRCNMACANCYIPNRDVPDMDVGRLRGLLDELPRRTEIRLVGAEPTMRRDLPEIIANAAAHREPHRVSNYLRDVAVAFTQFYGNCRIIGEAMELAEARLSLALAAKQVLHNGLSVLGLSAPERM